MKLGVSMWSYFRTWRAGEMDIPGFIQAAKEAGAEGVELLDFFYKGIGADKPVVLKADDVVAEREAALSALDEHGLRCVIFSIAQNFAKPDPADREMELAKICFGVDEAQHYGAKVVRVFAGDIHEGGPGFDEAREWIIEGLSQASRYAAERGTKLALENHGKLAGRGDQIRGIIQDVHERSGTDALGANPDTGNFLLVKQPSHEAIREVAEYANMVHFKDFMVAPDDYKGHAYTDLDGKRFMGTAIGEGEVDLPQCIQVLRDSGYQGWLSVEFEGEEDPRSAVPRSLQNARRFL